MSYSSLSSHKSSKHNPYNLLIRYKCTECDSEFTKNASLKTHIESIHTGLRYPCTKCNKIFKTKSQLRAHEVTKHDENGPDFICKVCPYSTKIKRLLKYHHQDTHEDNTFFCKKCDYQNTSKSKLNSHIRIRHSQKQESNEYICELCEYKTNKLFYLRQHTKYKHDDSIPLHKCDFCDFKTKYPNLRRHIQENHIDVKILFC